MNESFSDDLGSQFSRPGFEFELEKFPNDEASRHEFCTGEAQRSLIERYLSLSSVEQLTSLAARMSPKSDVFDADELVSRASSLTFQAEKSLWRKGVEIALKMNLASLDELAVKLDIPGIGSCHSNLAAQGWCIPITGPVKMVSTRRYIWLQAGEGEKKNFLTIKRYFVIENPAKEIAETDEKALHKHPSAPAPFLEVLRWAASEPAVDEKYLRKAFLDLLSVFLSGPELYSRPALVSLLGHDLSPWKKLYEKELKKFCKSFRPENDIPWTAQTVGAWAFKEYWDSELLCEERIAWMAVNFSSFWKKYRAAYLNRDSNHAELSAKKARAAKSMHVRRDTKKFISIIDEFFQSRGCEKIPKTGNERKKVFMNFVEEELARETERTQEDLTELFETLHTGGDDDLDTTLVRLKRSRLERFLALPDEDKEKRRGRMTSVNQCKLDKGLIPKSLEAFLNLEKEGLEECRGAWKDGLTKMK